MQAGAHADASAAADAGVQYSDANVATTLSLLPFSEHCKLRDDGVAKPLIRGRYTGMCGGDPAQRERRDDFEHITLSTASGSGSSSTTTVWGQVEAYSRSAAGKTIDPAHQRTPLALEKTMHFLVEHYLRVPHTPLVYAEPFRVWGYLWDRFRGIRTTWGPQLPPSNVRLDGYVDSETGALLPVEQLRQESYRRVRWLEFTAAALAVGGAYLCCSPEGCQRFMQDKKQFLESMSQCFTDLTVFYRAEQRPRNAEFFSVLLLLYGFQQEMKVEDRSTFCRFYTVTVDGEPRLCPESTAESVNFAQVYRELEKQPYMLETQPVQIALQLLHTWSRRQWFAFFELCRTARMTPLQRAVVFQSFTYARFRAVLDLVLPNHYVYPRLRVRHAVAVTELAGQLMMEEEHCLEFLKRMGLGAQLEYRAASPAATSTAAFSPVSSGLGGHSSAPSSSSALGWYVNLCHPNSTPLVTADELEKRCDNKRTLFFPTYPSFFGFRVAHEAYTRFPGARGMARPANGSGGGGGTGASGAAAALGDGSGSPVGRGAVRSPSALQRQRHRHSGSDGDKEGEDFYHDEYCSDHDGDADGGDEDEGGDGENGDDDDNDGEADEGDGGTSAGHSSASAPRDASGTATSPASAAQQQQQQADAALLRQLGCPVNLMEVLEVYCPPYHAEVAALRLSDTSDALFADLPRHRAAMLRRCRLARRLSWHWRDAAAVLGTGEDALEEGGDDVEDWCAKMDLESASTASSFYDDDESAGDSADGVDVENEEEAQTESGAEASGAAVGEVPTLVSEARRLVTSIRDSPLYAAAAAERRAAAAAAAVAKHKKEAGPGSSVPFLPSPFTHRANTAQQQQQQPHKTTSVLALTETAGRCVVVPLPDDHRAEPAERCNSENARVVVESPTSLPAQRLADPLHRPQPQDGSGSSHGASPAPSRSRIGEGAEDQQQQQQQQTSTTSAAHTRNAREGSAETVEAREQPPLSFTQRGAAAASMPPRPAFHTAMPQSTAAATTTPGKRPADPAAAAATTRTTTPWGAGGSRAGRAGSADSRSNSSSRGSSAPLLGYSHLKPAKEGSVGSSTAAVENVHSGSEGEDGEEDSGSAQSSASASSAGERSLSASEGGSSEDDLRGDLPTSPPSPALPALWESRSAQVPATPSAVDSFTPRPPPGEEPSGASTALVPAGPRDLVPMPDDSDAAASRKRVKSESSMRSTAAAAACPLLRRSSVDVFSRVCAPLIHEYLRLWVQLTHGDTEAMQAAAQYVVDVRTAEQDAARSGEHDGGEEDGQRSSTRRWRTRRAHAGASFADGGVNAAWWHERQLQRTHASLQRAASRLFTAAVLRGRMSEYSQLVYDLSVSCCAATTPGAVASATAAIRGFGVSSIDHSSGGLSRASSGATDDARAGRLCQGCSVAMVSGREAAQAMSAAASVLGTAHRAAVEQERERLRQHRLDAWRRQSEDGLHRIVRGLMGSPGSVFTRASASADDLVELLSAAAGAGLDAAVARERASVFAGGGAAAADAPGAAADSLLQLTSLFVWVAQPASPATPAAVVETCNCSGGSIGWATPTSAASPSAAAALASLFPSVTERWLASLLLPATAATAAAVPASMLDADGGAAVDWRLPQASLQGRKRRRHAQPDEATSGDDVVWLRVGRDTAHGQGDASHVARLLVRDELSHVPVECTSASAALHRSVRVVTSQPLLSRIALYGCDARVLPHLRVRRDGTVRLAQANTHTSAVEDTGRSSSAAAGDASVQVTADGSMLQAPAMSHAHYTALLTVDTTLPSDARHAALLRALAAIVASYVPATHAASNGAVAEQNTVAGVLVCVVRDTAYTSAATSQEGTTREVEALFEELWARRHEPGASRKAAHVHQCPPVPPPVVCVDVAYGDASGASAAVEAGMQALLSTYAERAVMALAEDTT